jgi:hypothetical protein
MEQSHYKNDKTKLFGSSDITPQNAEEAQEDLASVGMTILSLSLQKQAASLITGYFYFFGATALIWALAYLHETFRFTSLY